MALTFREQVLAGLVSPDVPDWAAELHRADKLATSAAKTKNKDKRDKLLAEAEAIRTKVEERQLEDEKNARERWRARLTGQKTEGK